jgi:hypothetical protein
MSGCRCVISIEPWKDKYGKGKRNQIIALPLAIPCLHAAKPLFFKDHFNNKKT